MLDEDIMVTFNLVAVRVYSSVSFKLSSIQLNSAQYQPNLSYKYLLGSSPRDKETIDISVVEQCEELKPSLIINALLNYMQSWVQRQACVWCVWWW